MDQYAQKHFDALDALFESVEEEIGPNCGEHLQQAMCQAKEVLDEDRAEQK